MAHPDYFNDPFWIPPVDSDIAVTGGEQLYVGIEMKMGGLGTIAAKTAQPKTSLKFIIRPQDKTKQPTLKLEITKNTCNLYKVDPTSGTEEIKCEFPKGKKSAYLNVATKDETVYWISVDRSNGRFRYGQHLTNASMTYLQFVFKEKGWMNNLKTTDVYKDDKVSLDMVHSYASGADSPGRSFRRRNLNITFYQSPWIFHPWWYRSSRSR